MCGITGFLGFKNIDNPEAAINLMGKSINYRGPDNFSTWIDYEDEVAFAHNRLSIIDLDSRANQPMFDQAKNFIIVFNGEIYNFHNLKKEINQIYKNTDHFKWKTNSDTEVLLQGIALFGVEEFVKKIEGMFSFALWDIKKKELTLCKDRFGEKPLYYGQQNNLFFFTSDLNVLRHNKLIKRVIRTNSVLDLINSSFISTPFTIYENIFKLEAGSILKFSSNNKQSQIIKYWKTKDIFLQKQNNKQLNINEAVEKFDYLLYDILKKTTIADKPIAFFLSGGIDSSLLTSIYSSFASKKVQTFTAGFRDKNLGISVDESEYARNISKHLNTNHHIFYFSEKDLHDCIVDLPKIYSEPFGDSSGLAVHLMSKEIKKYCDVAIGGDGGDELFGGYFRHEQGLKYWSKYNNSAIKPFFRYLERTKILSFLNIFLKRINLNLLPFDPQFKISKFNKVLNSVSLYDYYVESITAMRQQDIDFNYAEFEEVLMNNKIKDVDKLRFLDLMIYMKDNILVKVDRASMYNSLEVRSPYLNHNLFSFFGSLSDNVKYNSKVPKYFAKKILTKYLPLNLFNRPKQGFEIPVNSWLLGERTLFYEDLIFNKKTNLYQIIDFDYYKQQWNLYKLKKMNHSKLFWNILMYQSWYMQHHS
jgi:asparagine synthase (glutamine-hydrolysing)